jgi:hypothetical protein
MSMWDTEGSWGVQFDVTDWVREWDCWGREDASRDEEMTTYLKRSANSCFDDCGASERKFWSTI